MNTRKREHFTLPPALETGVLLYLQGAATMNPNCVRKPEQIKLIMECRQSGLSDYQWCRKQGIHPGTFYNWVSKLRKAGYNIPDSESRSSALPAMQEVVKLDLAEHEAPAPAMAGQNANLPSPAAVSGIAAEMECGNIRVRIFNGADPAVIRNTLHCIGGMSHAW